MSVYKSNSCLSGNHEKCDRLVWHLPLIEPSWEYCTCTECGCDGLGEEWA